jgi:hypothetical protein
MASGVNPQEFNDRLIFDVMNAQTIAPAASAFVAAVSAGVSVYYSHRATRRAEQSAQNQYEDNIRVWAERTIDVTGHLVELFHNPGREDEFITARTTLLGLLRCQIDKGRWYFPNTHTQDKGASKPAAFRGIRQPIVDVLVFLYQASRTAKWDALPSARSRVENLHRQFVSEVQHRLNPTDRDANYRTYVAQVSAQFVEESLSRPDGAQAVVAPAHRGETVSQAPKGEGP